MARRKTEKYEIPHIIAKMKEYIQDCNVDGTQRTKSGQRKPLRIPIMKECCLKNGWNYDYIYELSRDNPELREIVEELIGWKEVVLEQGMLYGTIKPGAAIFSLKQLGWKDNQSVQISQTDSNVDDDELTKSLEELAKTL